MVPLSDFLTSLAKGQSISEHQEGGPRLNSGGNQKGSNVSVGLPQSQRDFGGGFS